MSPHRNAFRGSVVAAALLDVRGRAPSPCPVSASMAARDDRRCLLPRRSRRQMWASVDWASCRVSRMFRTSTSCLLTDLGRWSGLRRVRRHALPPAARLEQAAVAATAVLDSFLLGAAADRQRRPVWLVAGVFLDERARLRHLARARHRSVSAALPDGRARSCSTKAARGASRRPPRPAPCAASRCSRKAAIGVARRESPSACCSSRCGAASVAFPGPAWRSGLALFLAIGLSPVRADDRPRSVPLSAGSWSSRSWPASHWATEGHRHGLLYLPAHVLAGMLPWDAARADRGTGSASPAARRARRGAGPLPAAVGGRSVPLLRGLRDEARDVSPARRYPAQRSFVARAAERRLLDDLVRPGRAGVLRSP